MPQRCRTDRQSNKEKEQEQEDRGRRCRKKQRQDKQQAKNAGQDQESAYLTFPVVGTGAKTWVLSADKVAEYREAFPGLNVDAELRKALQWIRDNPKRRKTPSGMTKFLGGWLGRVQDRGGGASMARAQETLPDIFEGVKLEE